MLWVDKSRIAQQLGKSASEKWDDWSFGFKIGWCKELAKLEKKYRKITWISISTASGWKKASVIRQFFHDVLNGQTKIQEG